MTHSFSFHLCPASQTDLDTFTDIALNRVLRVKYQDIMSGDKPSNVTEKELDALLLEMGQSLKFQTIDDVGSLVTFNLDF